jgi:asparagine synthase (glutamine-hydrolysing)
VEYWHLIFQKKSRELITQVYNLLKPKSIVDMCGIAGFFEPTREAHQAGPILNGMLETISHRGPDARGTFSDNGYHLGHNRLSIIDLQEAANQPFAKGDLHLVFNGEIYNYLEIREKLEALGYSFQTASDTEVLLTAYMAYGTDCVHHFMGMWAFAIYDPIRQLLFCSRDRFGIKPFYYHHAHNRFVFASEAKAVLAHPGVEKKTNGRMISCFLQHGWVDNGQDTFFQDLFVLPPAHNLLLKNGQLELVRYWDLPVDKKGLPDEEAIQNFQMRFRESVKLHSRSDVQLGSCLSGGLDSSAICAIQAHDNPKIKLDAFHIYYTGPQGIDERPFATSLAQHYPEQIQLHTRSPQGSELAAHFADFMYHMEVPVPSSSPYSQYFVMQLAKSKGVTVVLDGQGADEYLAGYKHGLYRYLLDCFRFEGFCAFRKALTTLCEIRGFRGMAKIDLMLKTLMTGLFSENKLYKIEYRHYLPGLGIQDGTDHIRTTKDKRRLLQFLYHQLFQTGLNNLLLYEDRNSMRWSLESRVPFLDHRLVEGVFAEAPHLIVKEGWSKFILRKALESFLPDSVTWRRDKKGFVTPGEVLWMNGALKDLLMTPEWTFPKNTVDEAKALKLKKAYESGNMKHAQVVWRLAVLSYWWREVFPKF